MSIEVVWDDKVENVIVYKFTGNWTWQDFVVAFDRELELAKSINGRRYDVIADMLHSQPLPPGSGITYVYNVFKRYPTNWGITIIVTPNRYIRLMVRLGILVHPDTRGGFFLRDTLDHARALIQQKRRH